jgi:hypothetical protein
MVAAAGFLEGSGNQFAKSGWGGDEIGGMRGCWERWRVEWLGFLR